MERASCKVVEFQWEKLLRETLLHGRSKLLGGRVPVREAPIRSCAPWEEQAARASYKVAESQWKRFLREALLHGRSKLLGGRVPVGEALKRGFAPWEEQAERWRSPNGRGSCAKRCSMEGARC
ncbi:hypothetical protein Adt_18575 [Abeliophyllum distichum]|uniref:Uncharacterized protein n=1 Tax=Abeliophyllum distichum TaxID=126358 RepID=A0ABD1TKL0_9LAMI